MHINKKNILAFLSVLLLVFIFIPGSKLKSINFIPTNVQAQTNPLDIVYDGSLGKLIRDLFYLISSGTLSPQGGEPYVHNPGSLTPGVGVTIPPILGTPIPFTPPAGYVYYAQCGIPPSGGPDYTNVPLPDGCNLCKAGCGPTTVAMVLASLVNKNFNPENVVRHYSNNNYYAGCGGSYYSHARNSLIALSAPFGSLKTTDYLVYSEQTIDKIANDMRGYLNSGWTLFALANYCDGGCGHFFWIIKIDNNNNIWAYDPYYGRRQLPPLNENAYYPFPKYRVAFGIKK